MTDYICNVETWGAAPSYRRGQQIPDDCPYDVKDAVKRGKVVTKAEYQKLHPEWDPEAEAKLANLPPGHELPTAADPPDPKAQPEPEPEPEERIQVAPAQPSPKSGGPRGS